MYFYKIKGQDMPFELAIQVWKIMSFRWRPSSWMQFSILRLKSSIARADSCWSIVSTSCRMASFNSFKLRGLWVYTRPFRYPQRHTAHAPMNVLRNMFPGRIISRFGDVPWPQGLLTCHYVISSSEGTWRAVFTLTNPVIWTSWRMPSGKKCSRSINSC